MKKNDMKIEERIKKLKSIYLSLEKWIDENELLKLLPKEKIDSLKKAILEDKELKDLMEGIENRRAPRILLVGRTGVGKSSFINALCGEYIAEVSDVESCTSSTTKYSYIKDDKVLMDILDSRGTEESKQINEETAEDELLETIIEFDPDVVVFMLNATHRDGVDKDAEFVKKISKRYEEINSLNLPVVVAVNKCDQLAKPGEENPNKYSTGTLDSIDSVVKNYKEIIIRANLKIESIIGISSRIAWETEDGMCVNAEEINCLPAEDVNNLKIGVDYRFNIDELEACMENAIIDNDARMGLRMAARLEDVVKRLSKKIINIISGISGVVAVSPIPISDFPVLIGLQTLMVTLIAMLSGSEISQKEAKKFLFSLGGVGAIGFAAQQVAKLGNALFPGAGSVVSSAVAVSGTKVIGSAAIKYYIEHKSVKNIKKSIKKED